MNELDDSFVVSEPNIWLWESLKVRTCFNVSGIAWFKPESGREMLKEFVINGCEAWRPLRCLSSMLCNITSRTRFLAVKRPSGCLKTLSKPKDVSAVGCEGELLSMAEMRRGLYGCTVRTQHLARDLHAGTRGLTFTGTGIVAV